MGPEPGAGHDLGQGRHPDHAISFDGFTLIPGQKTLLRAGRPVSIGSRALDILVALVEQRGTLVGREALIARVWPDTIVEDTNLRVHVSALRRALGDGVGGRRFVITVPGRGYQFVAATSVGPDPRGVPRAVAPGALPATPSLPRPLSRIVGREEFTAAVLAQLAQRRFVTIVGSGGIGKTTVAVAAADAARAGFPGGVLFLDLPVAAQSGSVPQALAFALGISSFSDDPMPGILGALQGRRMLIVLDSCEQAIDGAALMAETLLRAVPGLHILATSREKLRAEGERVLRMPPLDTPPILPDLTASQAMQFAAVQLFVEHVSASAGAFTLTDADAVVVAGICARLGGIALAIELAASQVQAVGLANLPALLDDRFRLLGRGRRTALARHQTMRALLDWSYETLDAQERLTLLRLAVFEGPTTLAAIREVIGSAGLEPDRVVECLANLVDKSLVATEIDGDAVHYRLLDTTCAYARERLQESGELDDVSRRHAETYLALFARAAADWSRLEPASWLATYVPEIRNAQRALDWAFSAGGDARLGAALAAASVPLLFEVSMVDSCRRRAAQALSVMAADPARDRVLEMRLRATMAAAMMYTPGPTAQTEAIWRSVLARARAIGDAGTTYRALWGLWTAGVYGGRSLDALDFAEQFAAAAARDADETKSLLAHRLAGVALLQSGDLRQARQRLEAMLAGYVREIHRWHTLGSRVDNGQMTQVALAVVLWLQGVPAQSAAMLARLRDELDRDGFPIAQGYALFEATIPLAFMSGDLGAAQAAVAALQALAARNGLAIWQAAGRSAELALRAARGEAVTLAAFAAAIADQRATGYAASVPWLSAVMAEAAGQRGEAEGALALLDEVMAENGRTGNMWFQPELLRIRAGIEAAQPATRADAAATLRQACALAESQGALAWELRSAVALVRLQPAAPSRALLAAVLGRFADGADGPELRQAAALVAEG